MLQAGTIIDGRYEIRTLIGSGGMGSVYEAYQAGLDRIVAVKMLTSIAPEAAEDLRRFEREAVILSRLNHPNIVKFYAYGQFNDLPYIVMERLHGESLQSVLFGATPPSPHVILQYGIEICRGLECAHANGIFHRDIKPSNVILQDTNNGATVKLIDFGLAKLSLEWQAQKLTQTGLAVGSVMYMSPEQCTGQPIDARADVYSIGCLLFHGLTGLPPFCADEAVGMMFQHLNQPINEAQGWEQLSPPIQKLIEKCMSKDQNKRYPNVADLREELESFAATNRVITSSNSGVAAARPRSQKKPFNKVALIAVAGLAASAGFFGAQWLNHEPIETYSPTDELTELTHPGSGAAIVGTEYIARLERCIETNKTDPSVRHDKLLNAYMRLGTAYLAQNRNEDARRILEEAFSTCTKATGSSYKTRLQAALDHHVACKRLNLPTQGKALLEHSIKFAEAKHSPHFSRAEIALASIYTHENRTDLAKPHFEHAGQHVAVIRREELIEGMKLAIQFGNVVKPKNSQWLHESTPLPVDDTPFSQASAVQYLHSLISKGTTHLCTPGEAAKVIRALSVAKSAPASAQKDLLVGYRMLEYFYSCENNFRSAAAIAEEGMDLCQQIRPESRSLYAHLACAAYTDVIMRNRERPDDKYIKIALRNIPRAGTERSELQLVAAGIALKNNDLQTAHQLFAQSAPKLEVLFNAGEVSMAFDLARQFGMSAFDEPVAAAVKKAQR